jgi:ABC-type nickel/cobalt efflux system permease component RcnA
MHATSLLLLLGAAATVAILHSILPDHWVPLAIVARTQHWSWLRVARVSALASAGHVIASLVLGGIIALIGLQFQRQIDTQQGHIIGGILILTGLGFLIWGLLGRGHGHARGHTHDAVLMHEHGHDSPHDHGQGHSRTHEHATHSHGHPHDEHDHPHDDSQQLQHLAREQTLARRMATIAVPFGVAASPDLTILPVALAASAVGGGPVVSVLGVFAALTIATFMGLTVLATLAGYQIKGVWLENNANTITSLVLIAIGIVAYVGF